MAPRFNFMTFRNKTSNINAEDTILEKKGFGMIWQLKIYGKLRCGRIKHLASSACVKSKCESRPHV